MLRYMLVKKRVTKDRGRRAEEAAVKRAEVTKVRRKANYGGASQLRRAKNKRQSWDIENRRLTTADGEAEYGGIRDARNVTEVGCEKGFLPVGWRNGTRQEGGKQRREAQTAGW